MGGGGEHHPSFWPWLLEVPLTVFPLVSNRSILVLPNHESVHSEGVGRNNAGYLVDSVPFVTGLELDRVGNLVLSKDHVKSCREILCCLTIAITVD